MHDGRRELNDETARMGSNIREELEETKQSLVKAREESMKMADSLSFLQEELEKTKRELQEIKEEKEQLNIMDILHEDLKFAEDKNINIIVNSAKEFDEKTVDEFQKKRYVTFAEAPPLLSKATTEEAAVLRRHPSLRKSKKKSFIPLLNIKGIFRKKGSCTSELTTRGP